MAFHKLGAQIHTGFLHQLVIVVDEVVITLKLDQLIAFLEDTVNIEVIIIGTI